MSKMTQTTRLLRDFGATQHEQTTSSGDGE
jgi:hypothetical protein